jgi:hypothetical protein
MKYTCKTRISFSSNLTFSMSLQRHSKHFHVATYDRQHDRYADPVCCIYRTLLAFKSTNKHRCIYPYIYINTHIPWLIGINSLLLVVLHQHKNNSQKQNKKTPNTFTLPICMILQKHQVGSSFTHAFFSIISLFYCI